MNNNNKGENMIKLKTLGATALAGSLVAVSAQAGEMSVTGGAIATYKTGSTVHGANTLGHKTNFQFTGSGEMDNGWTFSTFALVKDDISALSSSALTMTMGSLGTIGVSKGGGFNVNGGYDETYPRAYEENSDAGGDSSANYLGNWADDNALVYKLPAMDLMGLSVNVGVEYALQADGLATASDGGQNAQSSTYDGGYGLGVTAGYEGLTLGAYVAERDNRNEAVTHDVTDEFNGTWFANYSMGPVSIGYQETYIDAGIGGGASTANDYVTTSAKTVGTSGGIFEATSMSIAFNVNDDLSISISETEDTYDARSDLAIGTAETADVTQKPDSIQVSYSMGAMSVSAYTTEIVNPRYDENAETLNVNEIAIGLAF